MTPRGASSQPRALEGVKRRGSNAPGPRERRGTAPNPGSGPGGNAGAS